MSASLEPNQRAAQPMHQILRKEATHASKLRLKWPASDQLLYRLHYLVYTIFHICLKYMSLAELDALLDLSVCRNG